jgi:hypothetical protein
MSASTSQAVQTSISCPPVGFTVKLHKLVASMMRFDPAAAVLYAQNVEIRSSGRNWLM